MNIWKYRLYIGPLTVIEMPKGAEILAVQTQDGRPCIWAIVDPDAPVELRTFEMCGTGHKMKELAEDETRVYIGTVQIDRYVWHYFEIKEENDGA